MRLQSQWTTSSKQVHWFNVTPHSFTVLQREITQLKVSNFTQYTIVYDAINERKRGNLTPMKGNNWYYTQLSACTFDWWEYKSQRILQSWRASSSRVNICMEWPYNHSSLSILLQITKFLTTAFLATFLSKLLSNREQFEVIHNDFNTSTCDWWIWKHAELMWGS